MPQGMWGVSGDVKNILLLAGFKLCIIHSVDKSDSRVKRERDQQDATNLMFIIKLLSHHVSGIIMPIIRRT